VVVTCLALIIFIVAQNETCLIPLGSCAEYSLV